MLYSERVITITDKKLYTPNMLGSPWIHPDSPDWADLLKFGERKVEKKGVVLVNIGDVVNDFYYLHKGEVKLTAMTKNGLEKTIWYISSPGVFGETPFFHNQPSKFIISVSKDCEYYSFKKEFLMAELEHHPEIMKFILQLLAQKVRVLSAQVEELAFKEPLVRIANLIYLIVCQSGQKIDENKYVVEIRLTHQEIANITGLHRVTASNALKKLCDEGLISKNRSKITIKNIKLLEEIINNC